MTDVAVVGGGLGGCMAALAAVRDGAESVRVVAPNPERYRHETGLIDVLGYVPDRETPVVRLSFEMRRLPDDHPYNLVGAKVVDEALETFDDLFVADDGLPYERGQSDRNALFGTATGSVRPTSRYPESVSAGLLSDDRPVRIVGFEQLTHLDATLVGGRLAESVPYDVAATSVEFPMTPSEYPPVVEFARALDRNEETADGTPIREALANEIRPELDVEPRVGVPAVLGLEESEAVRSELETDLRAEVFEIPIGRPNLPGMRLGRRLFEVLEAEGVIVDERAPVVGVETAGERIENVSIAEDGTETEDTEQVRADTYVLATGGLAAGGIEADREGVSERVFDCHVPHPDGRENWTEAELLGDHPFVEFGVDVDGELRPCGPDGTPEYDNLRAAGTVIGGRDFVAEQSTGGVAISTGYAAALSALRDES